MIQSHRYIYPSFLCRNPTSHMIIPIPGQIGHSRKTRVLIIILLSFLFVSRPKRGASDPDSVSMREGKGDDHDHDEEACWLLGSRSTRGNRLCVSMDLMRLMGKHPLTPFPGCSALSFPPALLSPPGRGIPQDETNDPRFTTYDRACQARRKEVSKTKRGDQIHPYSILPVAR